MTSRNVSINKMVCEECSEKSSKEDYKKPKECCYYSSKCCKSSSFRSLRFSISEIIRLQDRN